ncbi:MAG: hypothetical protein ACREDR_33770, partial [Blastocatellia bacterium]
MLKGVKHPAAADFLPGGFGEKAAATAFADQRVYLLGKLFGYYDVSSFANNVWCANCLGTY